MDYKRDFFFTDKINKNSNINVKSWLYFKVFHEEFNSLDFHTVKRRLSNLKKSLEANALSKSKKRSGKQSFAKKSKTEKAIKVANNFARVSFQDDSNTSQTNCLPNQVLQPSNCCLQAYTNSSHNFNNVSMLSLPSNNYGSSNTTTFSQSSSNFHTHSESAPIGEQLSCSSHSHQPFNPLNLQSLGSNSVPSSYYLYLGRVSNLIPLPSSSSSSTTTTNVQQSQQAVSFTPGTILHQHLCYPQCNDEKFSAFSNMQYQLASTSNLLHSTRPSSGVLTQRPLNSPLLQSTVDQNYHSSLLPQSPNVNLMY